MLCSKTRQRLKAQRCDCAVIQWQQGDAAALERLLRLVYVELHRLASGYLRGERPGHTLQPTALIHEAYMRLVNQEIPGFRNRHHFYGVAAQMMRQVLVDPARGHKAQKRGDGERFSLSDAQGASFAERPHAIVALDEALSELAKIDERKL